MCVMARKAIATVWQAKISGYNGGGLRMARGELKTTVEKMLARYRLTSTSSKNTVNQLLLPESLRLLPLLALSFTKSPALRVSKPQNRDVSWKGSPSPDADGRARWLQHINRATPRALSAAIYPTVYSLRQMLDGARPVPLDASVASLEGDDVHVIFTGFDTYLLVGKQASPRLREEVFGAPPPVRGIPQGPADAQGAAPHIRELTRTVHGAEAPSDAPLRVAMAGHDDPSGRNEGRIEKILGALVDDGPMYGDGYRTFLRTTNTKVMARMKDMQMMF